MRIEITRETTIQDDSVELSHYDISINGMKTNVSAQSENPNGLFYPVEEDNKPEMAQIVAVDVCGQKSNPTMISCDSSPGGSLWLTIILFIIGIITMSYRNSNLCTYYYNYKRQCSYIHFGTNNNFGNHINTSQADANVVG